MPQDHHKWSLVAWTCPQYGQAVLMFIPMTAALMGLTKAPVATAMPWAWRPSCRRSRSVCWTTLMRSVMKLNLRREGVSLRFVARKQRQRAWCQDSRNRWPSRSASRGKSRRLVGSKDKCPTEHFQAQAPVSSQPSFRRKLRHLLANPPLSAQPSLTNSWSLWYRYNPETQMTPLTNLMSVEWPWMSWTSRSRFMIPTNGSDLGLKSVSERERGGSQHPPRSGLSRSHRSGSEQPHVSHNRCHTCSGDNLSSRFKTLHLFVSGFSVRRWEISSQNNDGVLDKLAKTGILPGPVPFCLASAGDLRFVNAFFQTQCSCYDDRFLILGYNWTCILLYMGCNSG